MFVEHYEFWCLFLTPTLLRFLTPNHIIEVIKLWLPAFVEGKNYPTPHLFNIELKKKQPPMLPCTLIIPYYNKKLVKTPNNLTTP